MGTSIIAGGEGFDIGVPVVLWNEEGGLNQYPKGNFHPRDLTLPALQSIIHQVVWHHSVLYTAKETFLGVNARSLSVNFIIDDDNVGGVATIYQTLDVKDAGYSQKANNTLGPGVEVAYHPEAWSSPSLYSAENCLRHGVQPHEVIDDVVHGGHFKCFGPSEPQMRAIFALAWGLGELFPLVPVSFPRRGDGGISKDLLAKPLEYVGHVCHYHIDREKIDAMGLDLERVEVEAAKRKGAGF